MKIRKGFVSNSSSSSFIVWEGTTLDSFDWLKNEDNNLIVDGTNGEVGFGWEHTTYETVGSKINFAYLQTLYGESQSENWLKMLEQAIREVIGVNKIFWNITIDWLDKTKTQGYIDHQSNAGEGENREMFESIDKLKIFLFCPSVYIQGGNDNE